MCVLFEYLYLKLYGILNKTMASVCSKLQITYMGNWTAKKLHFLFLYWNEIFKIF